MFERFTDRARRVVVLAQEEARQLNHNYIGTEHILLGLIREREGVAGRALAAMEISLDSVRQEVEAIIGRGKGAQSGHIPFTPRAKKVLELSLREAMQLGHNYIGTEHILLGLLREGKGVAAQVLVKLGADLDRVRQQVIKLVPGSEAGAGEPGEMSSQIRALGSRSQFGDVSRRLGEIAARLDDFGHRLSAIERHLGVTRDEPSHRTTTAAPVVPADPSASTDPSPSAPADPSATPAPADSGHVGHAEPPASGSPGEEESG